MPNAKVIPISPFRDTRPISKRLEDLKETISAEYLAAPSLGACKIIGDKHGFTESAIRTKVIQWGLSGKRDVVKRIENAEPLKKSLIRKITDMKAESSFKDVQGTVNQCIKEHEAYVHGHLTTIHQHIIQHAETRPLDLDDRLRWVDKVDSLARRLYGMKESEDIDPMKRGIALLAFGGSLPYSQPALGNIYPVQTVEIEEMEELEEVIDEEEEIPELQNDIVSSLPPDPNAYQELFEAEDELDPLDI